MRRRLLPCVVKRQNFNPRTPCGVRPRQKSNTPSHVTNFNPRTPCGVRQFDVSHFRSISSNFNPRTPCGVRHAQPIDKSTKDISIHAPRVGCDYFTFACDLRTQRFQSTHPVWGATEGVSLYGKTCRNFNPRTPCGVRRRYGKGQGVLR